MERMTIVELERVTRPLWGTVERVQELFGVPPALTRRMAYDGKIRQAKLGDAKQATRVYRLADVEEWLESLADNFDMQESEA